MIKKIIKFGFFGILTIILTLGITTILKEIGGFFYLVSYWIALLITTIINFILNIKVIFKVRSKIKKRIPKYLATLTFFLIINPYLVKIFTESLNFHYLISIIFVTGIVFILKFFIYNKLIFNN